MPLHILVISQYLKHPAFTGSLVAFMKLAGRMSSRPLLLPARHVINSSLLLANGASMGAFITGAAGAPTVAAACLLTNTALGFIKGYTIAGAVGGAGNYSNSSL